MKVLIALAALAVCAAANGSERGDLVCVIVGDIGCKINCMSSGHLNGKCDEDNLCDCDASTAVEPRSELVCVLGGTLACEINCLVHVGHFQGHCDENNDCKCEDKPTALSAPSARADLLCTIGNFACMLNCISSGHLNGFCDEEGKCDCSGNSATTVEERAELICVLGGTLGCEINCLTHTGHFQGHCDENNDCKCEDKPAESKRSVRSINHYPRDALACKIGGDATCAAFCHWTTGKQEGYCNEDDKCTCGPKA